MPTLGAAWYEPLAPADAAFLFVENARAHMHIGGVFLLEGDSPAYRDLVDHVASRLDRVPRYRQRIVSVALDVVRPVWVDDAGFRIEHHVRHAAVPSPGGDEGLKRLAARFFGEPLERDAPLWQLTLVDGLGPGRSALLWKTHHCVIDGIAFLDVLAALTDGEPGAGAPGRAAPWTPRPAPSGAALLAAAATGQLSRALELVGGALRPSPDARGTLHDTVAGLKPLVELSMEGRAPPSSLNQAIGADRRWEMPCLELAGLQRVRAALGGTVNDVVLAVVAGALRRLLLARGDELHRDLRAFVPVNVRPAAGRDDGGNRIGAIYCPLPVGEPDPIERFHRVSFSMARLKAAGAALGTASIVRFAELVPARLAADAARLEVAYRRSNLVVSNVPGPAAPRYLLGRRLASLHFGVPLADDQTLSIQFFSYAGTVGVGLLADAVRVPDLSLLAAAIPEALSELESRADAHPRTPAVARPR